MQDVDAIIFIKMFYVNLKPPTIESSPIIITTGTKNYILIFSTVKNKYLSFKSIC